MNPDKDLLFVITPLTNPLRFKSRYALYEMFAKKMGNNPHVVLTTVEVAFGDRPFQCTEANNPNHVQLRTWDELWNKENSINIAIQHVLQRHPEAQYFAWIDGDVEFVRPYWPQQTIQELQHFMFVQMWSHAIDLDPNHGMVQAHQSFMYNYSDNGFRLPADVVEPGGYGGYYGGIKDHRGHWHPGYAWAARREALDATGGLLDFAILGAGDHHMALGMVGQIERTMPRGISERYREKLLNWQRLSELYVKRDVGYVHGTIMHHWHGKKKDRRYSERWKILVDNKYDPELDVKRDTQGLWQLTDRSPRFRDDLRAYFRARREDSVDVE